MILIERFRRPVRFVFSRFNLPVILCALAFVFVATGCTMARKKEPSPAPVDLQKELSRIEIELNSGGKKKAVARLHKITAAYADTDAADDAHILLGRIYFDENQFENSYRNYIAVLNSEFFSPREVEAAFGAAKALYRLGRFDESLSLTSRALKNSRVSEQLKIEIYTLRYQLQTQLGDRLDALGSLVYLSSAVKDPDLQERYKIKANEFVESKLTEDELKEVAKKSSYGFVRIQALFRVGVSYFEQRDYGRAEGYFVDVRNASPQSDLASQAESYIEQIVARRRVAPYTIGAVLPLSGKYAAIGHKTLRGLKMGLGINNKNGSDFKIAVIDSEGHPDTARRAVEKLVVEDSVIALVGDLLSRTSEAVAMKADELDVPVIGLSQKSGLTQIGPNVFRNALTSDALVSDLVRSAMVDYGLKRFAIVYPNDAYGVEYANLFWDEVLARGGTITAAQTYATDEKDFRGLISRLVGTFFLEDRQSEYSTLLKNWYGNQKVISSRVNPPVDLLPPIVDFDAIFVADGVKALSQISSMLVYYDVDNVRLLGTNLWNNSTLVQKTSKLIENSLFIDSTSLVESQFQNSDFFLEYKKTYKEEPSTFEAQAYDTARALRTAISSGARSRSALRDAISRIHGFDGLVGQVRVTDQREFTRPLSILTVRDGQIVKATDLPPGSTQN